MPARLFLRCLGAPELRDAGGEVVKFRVRKHLALLVYLACERRTVHRRERLVDLLWPAARPAEGRHSLATAISVLRARLGRQAFEATRDTLRLVTTDLTLDLDRLAAGEVLGDADTPPLEVAGFLEDFEVGHAPEFMFWRDLMRARWLPHIRDALVLLLDRCRRRGEFSAIEPHAERLQVLDPLSEDAVRARMEGRAFAGDRVAALRIYNEWRGRLADELDASPSALLEGMALRLRQRGYTPAGAVAVPPVATEQWRGHAFVGRADQYRVLYERWESTRDGAGRHGLVLGDSGLGKTTLLERLVMAVSLEGAVSARVQCYEVERQIPYAAVGGLVRGLLDRPGAGGTSPEWLAELARMIPAVAQRYRNLPPPRDTTGESARLRFTEAVHELITAVAEEHPVVLVVDDVHLADDASVAVLHLLMRRTQEQRVAIWLAARETELGRSPNARRLLEAPEPLALEAVRLAPLTPEEMGIVVDTLATQAPTPPGPAVRGAMLGAAAGVPMLAELLFDDWRQHGAQCLALSVGAMTVYAEATAPGSAYEALFDRLLLGLTPTARAVLNLAALLGERLNDLTMYEIVDLTLAQTLRGMAELTGLRILRDGGRGVEFRNELLRQYTYLQVPSPLRMAVHGRIADRLLAAEARGEPVPGLMLAWHCFRAGRVAEAEPYLLRGARETLAKGAPLEAELALESGLATVSAATRVAAQLTLVETLQEQGRWAESLERLQACHEPLRHQPTEYRLSQALRAIADSQLCTSEEQASQHLRLVLLLLNTTPVEWEAVGPLLTAAYVLTARFSGSVPKERLLGIALGFVNSDAGLQARLSAARLAVLVAYQSRALRTHPTILVSLEKLSAELASATLESAIAGSFEFTVGTLFLTLGRYPDAILHLSNGQRIYRKVGNRTLECSALANLALARLRLGDYQQAISASQQAVSRTPPGVEYATVLLAHAWQAWALSMLGRRNEALSIVDRIVTEWSTITPAWQSQKVGLVAADLLKTLGEERKALAQASAVIEAHGIRPLSVGEIGRVARWVANTADAAVSQDAILELEALIFSEEEIDRIDVAEALSALIQHKKKLKADFDLEREQLSKTLGLLPEPITHQLARLGALS